MPEKLSSRPDDGRQKVILEMLVLCLVLACIRREVQPRMPRLTRAQRLELLKLESERRLFELKLFCFMVCFVGLLGVALFWLLLAYGYFN